MTLGVARLTTETDLRTVDDLPAWAQRLIRDLRRENAACRVIFKHVKAELRSAEVGLANIRERVRNGETLSPAQEQALRELAAAVTRKRETLERYHQLMTDASVPGAEHRGTKSFRVVSGTSRGF